MVVFCYRTLGGDIVDIDNHHNTEHIVIYNDKKFTVNSYHALSIKKLHSSGKVLAVDADNNIEAWIDNNVAGVVWHPERMETPWLPTEIEELLGN